MLNTRVPAAALLAGLTLSLAACGGGPSQEDFAKEANAICTDLEKSLERLGKSNPSSAEELTETVEQIQTEVADGVERLRDVERPSGEEGEAAEAFVSGLSKQVEEEIQPAFDDLKSAAREEDQKALASAAQQLQQVDSQKTSELARKAGADACAG